MQNGFEIELNDDAELIHRDHNAAAGRVVIDRFYLWLPKIIPKDTMSDQFVSSFLKETQWTYLRDVSCPARLRLLERVTEMPAERGRKKIARIPWIPLHSMEVLHCVPVD